MTYEEKLSLILQIRASRRISKKASSAVKKASTGSRKTKDIDLDSLLKGMSKEQLTKLLGGL
jgi:outer membrane protein assembly factor BamE (lipoprotein component of BamABCDE complex)